MNSGNTENVENEEMDKEKRIDTASNSSNKEPVIIYNSLNPHISLQLFFEQLFSHLLFPLSLPYFLWKYGRTFPIAHGFIPTEFASILANWLFPLAFLLVIITSQYLPHHIGNGYSVPVCIFLIHRFMVATKYATLSESEYAKYLDLNRPGGKYSPPSSDYLFNLSCYQTQLQLIRGWYQLTPETISYEIHAAARRLDIDLEHLLFYVPIPPSSTTSQDAQSSELFSICYQFELWKYFLKQENLQNQFPHITIPSFSSSPTNEYICIDSLIVCESILKLCNLSFSPLFFFPSLITSLSFAFIPILFIILYPSQYSHNVIPSSYYPLYIIFHISSFLINFLLFDSLVMILYVCIADAYRKYNFFTVLTSLIRPNDVDMDTLHITTNRNRHQPPSTQQSETAVTPPPVATSLASAAVTVRSVNYLRKQKISPTNAEVAPLKPFFKQRSRRNRKTSILMPTYGSPHYRSNIPSEINSPVVVKDSVQVMRIEEQEREMEESDEVHEVDEVDNEEAKTCDDHSKQSKPVTTPTPTHPPATLSLSSSSSPSYSKIKEIDDPTRARSSKRGITRRQSSSGTQYNFKAYVGTDNQSVVPRIDFEVRNNIFSWSSLRLVFHNFGERMKLRIDCYLGLVPLSFSLSLLLFLFLLSVSSLSISSSRSPSS